VPRQPFQKKFPGARITIGPDCLGARPRAASLIAQCICWWTEVELQTALLLARMLRANTEPVVALYFSLTNERAKREALMSIAESVFLDDDLGIFNAIIGLKKSLESQRNDLAHGLFGITDRDEEGVAWISTKDRIQHLIWTDQLVNPPWSLIRDGQIIAATEAASFYTISDLETLLTEMATLHHVTKAFSLCVNEKTLQDLKVFLRQKLLSEPLVQRFLSQINASPKSDH
jgi:hypothetical protein